MGEQVRAGNVDFWVERRGQGPEVLIISGLADPVEAWQFQLDGLQDRYRLTGYDNRGVGRTPMGEEPLTVPAAADDAAALLEALAVPTAHVVGHSILGRNWRSGKPERVRRRAERARLGSSGNGSDLGAAPERQVRIPRGRALRVRLRGACQARGRR
jgi:alpha/beta hydrolase fold